MKIPIALTLVTLSLALGLSARADLTWENQEVDLKPKLEDKTAVAHFKYKNNGDKPVKILDVHPSCGCTTAKLEKDTVAPNESGEIVATFNIGERLGLQKKSITVRTDAKPEPTILHLTADVPRLLELKPIFVFWPPGQELAPKTITATLGGDYPVNDLKVTSSDPSIATEVKKQSDNKSFLITVTPKESGRPINASLKITPDYPKDTPKTFSVYVRVDSRAPAVAK